MTDTVCWRRTERQEREIQLKAGGRRSDRHSRLTHTMTGRVRDKTDRIQIRGGLPNLKVYSYIHAGISLMDD